MAGLDEALDQTARIIDGDTWEKDGTRYRLKGADAPETEKTMHGAHQRQEAGADLATGMLDSALRQPGTEVTPTGERTYNREVARVTNGGEDLATRMISAGVARPTEWSTQKQLNAELGPITRRMGILPEATSEQQRALDVAMEQEWKDHPYKPDLGATPGVGPSTQGTFTRSVARGIDQTQGLLYAAANAAGELTGVDPVAKWGEEGFRQNMLEAASNPAEIGDSDNIHSLSDFGTYVVEAVGEQLPNVAAMATGAGAGAAAARAAVGKAVLKKLGEKAATRLMAGAGAAGGSYPLSVGEMQAEFKDAGIDAPGTAFLAGIPVAGLDAVGFDSMLGTFFKGVKRDAAKSLVDNIAQGFVAAGKGAAKAGLTEMPTEAAQELVQIAAHASQDPNYEIYSEQNLKRLREAGLKGLIVGGAFGAAGGAFSHVRAAGKAEPNTEGDSAQETPPAKPAASEDTSTEAPKAGTPAENVDLRDVIEGPAAPTTEAAATGSLDVPAAAAVGQDFAPSPASTPSAPHRMTGRLSALKPGTLETPVEAPTATQPAEAPHAAQVPQHDSLTAEQEQELANLLREDAAKRPADKLAEKPVAKVREEQAGGTPVRDAAPESAVLQNEGVTADEEGATTASLDVMMKKGASTVARRLKAMFPEARARQQGKGKWRVEVDVPPRGTRAAVFEDAHPERLVEKAAKVFVDGAVGQKKRVELQGPDGKKARANLQAVVNLGAELSGDARDAQKPTVQRVRDQLMTGLSWLADRGYQLPEGGIKKDTVVYGNGITWGMLHKIPEKIARLSGTVDRLEAKGARMTQAERSRLDRAKRELEQYGISDQDAGFDSRDIDQLAGHQETRDISGTTGRTKRGRSSEGVEPPEGVDRSIPYTNTTLEDSTEVVRNLPTDEEQARASAKQRAGHAPLSKAARQMKQAGDSLMSKSRQVTGRARSLSNKHLELMADVLQHVGIATRVTVVDEAGAVDLIAELKAQGTEASKAKAAKLEELLHDAPNGRILFNSEFENARDRTPTVFISENAQTDTQRLEVIAHELGHLVQRAALDAAPREVQSALREALGTENFEENFANQLVHWAMSRETPRNMVERLFQKIGRQLKKLWRRLTRKHKLDQTFADFMDALVAVRMQREGETGPETRLGRKYQEAISQITRSPFLPYNEASQYADFTPQDLIDEVRGLSGAGARATRGASYRTLRKAVGKRRAAKFIQETEKTGANLRSLLKTLHSNITQTNDAYLRNVGAAFATRLADHFHHRPGEVRGTTALPAEINRRQGPWMTRLEKLGERMPRVRRPVVDKVLGREHGKLATESPEYERIGKLLLSEKYDAAQLREMGEDVAAEVREYYDDLFDYLTNGMGLDIKRRKNYAPHIWDVDRVIRKEGKLREILNGTAMKPAEINELIDKLKQSDGVMFEAEQLVEQNVLSPSFAHSKSRVFDRDVQAKLADAGFYVTDVMAVAGTYTHAAIRRGAMQRRFAFTESQRKDPKLRKRVRLFLEQAGFEPSYAANAMSDPFGLLNYQLAQAKVNHELTDAQFRHIKGKVLPAYLGRLGAGLDPRLRRFNNFMVFYQNIRLLSFVLLSSLVDGGLITARSGDLLAPFKAAGELMRKQSREQLYEQARILGAVRDDVTEHVLNDTMGQHFVSLQMQRWNEGFFRLVRMHQWTNLTRAMALATGKQFIRVHAKEAAEGSAKSQGYLRELGLSQREAQEWVDSGFSMDEALWSRQMDAMHQFIDEAVLRPDPSIRPWWGSDPRFAVLWHLKQFTWAYHEMILRRAWAQTKGAPNMLAAALPFAMLGIATLPLAAAGYELRRQIGYAGEPPPMDGAGFFWETLQRSGAPGLFQLYIDADDAEKRGQFSILALAGPTLGQLGEFITKDVGYAASRSVPLMAQAPAARQWASDQFGGE